MSNRIEKFNGYASHPWLNKAYGKLSKKEKDLALAFIDLNDWLSKGDFELAINRMFIGNPEKPKNWTIIVELLTCANSAI